MMFHTLRAACLVAGVTALAVATVHAQGTMEGTVTATKNEAGKIETASFKTVLRGRDVELDVVLDAKGLQMATLGEARLLAVQGAVSKKKDQLQVKVKSFLFVLKGTLTVTREENKPVTAVDIVEASGTKHTLALDSLARRLAQEFADKPVLVTSAVVVKGETRTLVAKTCLLIESVTGRIEVQKDRKGNVRGGWLVKEGEKTPVKEMIVLDAVGNRLLSECDGKNVELEVAASGRGRSRLLKVLSYKSTE